LHIFFYYLEKIDIKKHKKHLLHYNAAAILLTLANLSMKDASLRVV